MNKKAVCRLLFAGVLGLGLPSIGLCQGVLTLGSVTGRAGSPAALNLSLSGTSASSGRTSLQFNLTYSASDFSTITAVAGPAAVAQAKSVLCSPSSGQLSCLIWGTNKNAISDGILLVLSAIPSTTSIASVRPIGISSVLSFDSTGSTLPGLTTVGGSVQISASVPTPALSSLTCTPSLLSSNTSATCTVSLSSAATSATTITVTDNNASLAVPASVTIPQGASQANFTATAGTLTGDSVAVVTASFNGVSQATSISLMSVPSLTSLTCTPTTLTYGASATCTVAFSRALPAASTIALSATSATSVASAPGLVAAYGFNEASGTELNDSSGNTNKGTISGASWNTAGRYGAALSFNGTSSRVDIPGTASLNLTTGMTMEAWVRPNVVPTGWRSILTKEKTGGLVYGLYGNSDTNRPSAHVSIGWEQDTRGTAQLAVNTWTHLTGTYDGTNLRIYVNGVLASTKMIGGSLPTSTGMLRIGGNVVWGEYFSGLIDEVRIYNRALSATEIQTDMNTPVGAAGGAISVPASVSVAAGASTASFKATAARVSVSTAASVTATSNGVSRSATITVVPTVDTSTSQSLLSTSSLKSSSVRTTTASSATTEAAVTDIATEARSLSCLPASIAQGGTSLCTLALDKPVAGATKVAVTTSPSLLAQSSITVPVGESSVQFEAAARTRGISDATVAATVNGQSFNTAIRISPKSLTVFAPDRQDSVNGDPVHFQVTTFEPNKLPVQLTASNVPAGAQFDAKTGEFAWQPNAQAEGTFPVTFTAANGAGATSSAQVVIDITSGDPVIEKIVNAATQSSEGACSPGSIASIQGKSLNRSTEEVTALVNGEQASILYTSAREIAIRCPNLPAGTPLQVKVIRGTAESNIVNSTMSAAGPGLFSVNNSGTGEALSESNSVSAIGFAKQLGETTGATTQNVVSFLGTGFGEAVSPESLKLVWGTTSLSVQSVNEELPGIWRISIPILNSASAGSQVPLRLIFNSGSSVFSSNTVTTAVVPSPAKPSAD